MLNVQVGDLVKKVMRDGQVHYGLVVSVEFHWIEVKWTHTQQNSFDAACSLEVVSKAA